MVCERTRLKKHIVIIDCTPKGQASEQMADDETTKQKKGPLQQASMLSLPHFQTDKACCNKPPKFQFTN